MITFSFLKKMFFILGTFFVVQIYAAQIINSSSSSILVTIRQKDLLKTCVMNSPLLSNVYLAHKSEYVPVLPLPMMRSLPLEITISFFDLYHQGNKQPFSIFGLETEEGVMLSSQAALLLLNHSHTTLDVEEEPFSEMRKFYITIRHNHSTSNELNITLYRTIVGE